MAKFRVENLETTGADATTVRRNLNMHGIDRFEHYDQIGPTAYLRATEFCWEYQVITIYGNSTTQSAAINALAADGWDHYLMFGSRGYFKRKIPPAAAPVPPVQVMREIPIHSVERSNGQKNGQPPMAIHQHGKGKRR